MGVGIPVRGLADPNVGPAESAIAPLLGHHPLGVRPDVDEHEVQVGDPSGREGGLDLGVRLHRLVDGIELVDGEVGGHAGTVGPRLDGIRGEIYDGFICLVVEAVEHD